jgi:uncharacterized protein (TIGR02246 family)
MKWIIRNCVLSLIVIPTLLFGQTPPAGTSSTQRKEDDEAIRQVLAEFTAAWNRHDAKAFSMVFAEDADFTNPGGKTARGRTEIERFHAPKFATYLKDSHLTITETKLRFITSEVAALDARWEMTGARRADGQARPLRKGLLNFIMTCADRRWFITVMHIMDFPERPDI